jgi:hypothetical protein
MKMNCDEARRAIRAAIDSDTTIDRAIRVHLATCSDCREDYADWMLERALAHDWVEPLREGFVDQVIAAAARDGAAGRLRRMAVAATIGVLAVGLGLFVGLRSGSDAATSVAQVGLIAHQGKQVRLMIDSAAAHDFATVTIELADDLELAGFPNERRIEWQTRLAAGRNLLTLPLTLTHPADSQFRVGLSYGSVRQDIRVRVKSQPNGTKA